MRCILIIVLIIFLNTNGYIQASGNFRLPSCAGLVQGVETQLGHRLNGVMVGNTFSPKKGVLRRLIQPIANPTARFIQRRWTLSSIPRYYHITHKDVIRAMRAIGRRSPKGDAVMEVNEATILLHNQLIARYEQGPREIMGLAIEGANALIMQKELQKLERPENRQLITIDNNQFLTREVQVYKKELVDNPNMENPFEKRIISIHVEPGEVNSRRIMDLTGQKKEQEAIADKIFGSGSSSVFGSGKGLFEQRMIEHAMHHELIRNLIGSHQSYVSSYKSIHGSRPQDILPAEMTLIEKSQALLERADLAPHPFLREKLTEYIAPIAEVKNFAGDTYRSAVDFSKSVSDIQSVAGMVKAGGIALLGVSLAIWHFFKNGDEKCDKAGWATDNVKCYKNLLDNDFPGSLAAYLETGSSPLLKDKTDHNNVLRSKIKKTLDKEEASKTVSEVYLAFSKWMRDYLELHQQSQLVTNQPKIRDDPVKVAVLKRFIYKQREDPDLYKMIITFLESIGESGSEDMLYQIIAKDPVTGFYLQSFHQKWPAIQHQLETGLSARAILDRLIYEQHEEALKAKGKKK